MRPCQSQLVIEAFVVGHGSGKMANADRSGLYPVRIASCLEGCLVRQIPPNGIVYQMPSSAKRFMTDERLRAAGLWIRGSDHQRDAARHMALRLGTLGS